MSTHTISPAMRPAAPPTSPATTLLPVPEWFAQTILEQAALRASLQGDWRNGPPRIVTGSTTVAKKTSTTAAALMPRKALSGSATPVVTPRSQIGMSLTPQGTPDPKSGPLGAKTVRTLHGVPAGVHMNSLTSDWALGN